MPETMTIDKDLLPGENSIEDLAKLIHDNPETRALKELIQKSIASLHSSNTTEVQLDQLEARLSSLAIFSDPTLALLFQGGKGRVMPLKEGHARYRRNHYNNTVETVTMGSEHTVSQERSVSFDKAQYFRTNAMGVAMSVNDKAQVEAAIDLGDLVVPAIVSHITGSMGYLWHWGNPGNGINPLTLEVDLTGGGNPYHPYGLEWLVGSSRANGTGNQISRGIRIELGLANGEPESIGNYNDPQSILRDMKAEFLANGAESQDRKDGRHQGYLYMSDELRAAMSTSNLTQFLQLGTPIREYTFHFGRKGYAWEDLPILGSMAMRSSKVYNIMGAVTATTASTGGSLSDGTYAFKVTKTSLKGGESIATAEVQITINAGTATQIITLNLPDETLEHDDLERDRRASGYIVYKGTAGGNNNTFVPHMVVDAYNRDGDGAVTTRITQIVVTSATAEDGVSMQFAKRPPVIAGDLVPEEIKLYDFDWRMQLMLYNTRKGTAGPGPRLIQIRPVDPGKTLKDEKMGWVYWGSAPGAQKSHVSADNIAHPGIN